MKKIIILLFLAQTCFAQNKMAHFKKVVWIVFENENYTAAMQQPDFSQISKQGVSFSNFLAETHPSQPNYISMISGSTLGVLLDNSVNLTENHIGDLLESKNMDWKVYAEDYPGNCFTGSTSGDYARKHVPFLSFTNVTGNLSRCGKIQNADHFFEDYNQNSLPEYTMYVPNLKNDGHNTNVNYAGKWLTSKFGKIISDPLAVKDTLFIFTFDESGFSLFNQIYTVVLGANVIAGSVNNQTVNHPALLKMIEDEFELGNLGRGDAAAPIITGIWKN